MGHAQVVVRLTRHTRFSIHPEEPTNARIAFTIAVACVVVAKPSVRLVEARGGQL